MSGGHDREDEDRAQVGSGGEDHRHARPAGRRRGSGDRSTLPQRPAGDWFSRSILWAAAVVVGLALVVIAAAYLPGWWADRVGDLVAGNRAAGVLAGVIGGALFAVLPLVVLRSAVRAGLGWRERLVRLTIAVLLAVPDLLTLAAVTGGNGGTTSAVLDTRGPGFVVGSLAGAVVGVAGLVTIWVLLADRRRHVHEVHDLRNELRLRDAPAGTAAHGRPASEHRDRPAADHRDREAPEHRDREAPEQRDRPASDHRDREAPEQRDREDGP